MKFILGKKVEMSQKYKEDGRIIPVTIVKAGPCFISQVKNAEKDGYQSVQIGLEGKKKLNKSLSGHLKGLKTSRCLKEFRTQNEVELQKGQEITVAVFIPGEKVNVTAASKGKGFQGVVKRHHFSGAPKSHGNKDQLRKGGSIGAQRPQRVIKNKRMAGHMGDEQVTVKNLEVIEIDDKNNLIYIKGAIPGSRNALVKIVGDGEMKLAAPIISSEKPVTPETTVVTEDSAEIKSVENVENKEPVVDVVENK